MTMVCAASETSDIDLPEIKPGLHHGNVDGIEVYQFPLRYSNSDGLVKRALIFLKFSWNSVQLALRLEYDLLFASSTPLTAGIPGICIKLLGRRKPFVFEVRDLWPELPKAMGVVTNPFVHSSFILFPTSHYVIARDISLSYESIFHFPTIRRNQNLLLHPTES